MNNIKIPISMDGASFDAGEIEEQRQDGTRATELSLLGAEGFALDFDGGDYVNCGSNSTGTGADITTGALSLVAWVKTTDSTVHTVIGKVGGSSAHQYDLILLTNGYFRFLVGSGSVFKSIGFNDTSLNDGGWHLIIGTWEQAGGTCHVYLDNVEDVTPNYDGSFVTTNALGDGGNLYIGKRGDGLNFTGSIDEVQIYDKVLTSDERTALWDNGVGRRGTSEDDGIVAGWHLDEGEGTTIADYSGGGVTGSLGSGATEPSWVEGKIISIISSSEPELADLDSKLDNSSWDMSTIEIFENPNSEAGTIKYQYAYGNSSSPSNWNGSWLTKAELKSESDPSGRYFKLKAQLDGGGIVDVTLSDGWIECNIVSGGGEQSHAFVS